MVLFESVNKNHSTKMNNHHWLSRLASPIYYIGSVTILAFGPGPILKIGPNSTYYSQVLLPLEDQHTLGLDILSLR